ncbi:OpgC family protein [Salinisphaera hydrothermalis]|uniref:OpgC family protein n=1 Tax=Salinisphaera hydrothermalis TaxID=563188 RepID=UPI003342A8A2
MKPSLQTVGHALWRSPDERNTDPRRAHRPAREPEVPGEHRRPGRDNRIDTLRGLLLVIMTIDHLGGPLYAISYSPLGFVTAAEGFVFLSGYMFALAYVLRAPDLRTLRRTSIRRAALIYRYYIAALALLVGLTWLLPRLGVYWHLGGTIHHPWVWNLLSFAMVNQPAYFDILPMYVVFVLVTPFAVLGIRRGYAGLVVAASVGIWAIGSLLHPAGPLTALLAGDYRAGHFNLLCWQLLWMLGLLLGCYRDTVRRALGRMPASAWLALLVFLGALCLARHDLLSIGLSAQDSALDSTKMGWLRLFDTLGLLLLTAGLLRFVPRTARVPWLDYLGRSSIQVFTFQVLLVYLDMGIGFRVEALGSPALHVVYTLACVLMLTLPAFLHHRRRQRA